MGWTKDRIQLATGRLLLFQKVVVYNLIVFLWEKTYCESSAVSSSYTFFLSDSSSGRYFTINSSNSCVTQYLLSARYWKTILFYISILFSHRIKQAKQFGWFSKAFSTDSHSQFWIRGGGTLQWMTPARQSFCGSARSLKTRPQREPSSPREAWDLLLHKPSARSCSLPLPSPHLRPVPTPGLMGTWNWHFYWETKI